MTQPTDHLKTNYGFFHSVGRTLTEENQYTFNSSYSSGHVVFPKDVLLSTIPYCATQTDADNYAFANPTIVKKYTQFSLTEIIGSNGQSWYINDTTWQKPILQPSLIPEVGTNNPSNGFLPKLYKGDNTFISPSNGVWFIDPFQGIVHFEVGYTPADLGWGIPKITCYVYIGETLQDGLPDGNQFVHLTGTESISGNKTFVDDTTFNGEVNINGAYVATLESNNISTNTTLDIFSATKGTAVFWDILISDDAGDNLRASRLFAIWKNSTLEIKLVETSTESIGVTEGVSLAVSYRNSNADIALRASVISGIWNIKVSRKLL